MATEEMVASNSVINRTSNIPTTNTMTDIPTMDNNCHGTITFPLTSSSPTISSSQWTQRERANSMGQQQQNSCSQAEPPITSVGACNLGQETHTPLTSVIPLHVIP